MPKLGRSSRRPPAVVLEEASQLLAALDITIHSGRAARVFDQLIVEALAIALEMVVLAALHHRLALMTLAQTN